MFWFDADSTEAKQTAELIAIVVNVAATIQHIFRRYSEKQYLRVYVKTAIITIYIVAGQWVWGFHATRLNRQNDPTHREQFKGRVYLQGN